MPNRLYYVVKLSSSLLKEYNYSLNLSFSQCLDAGLIISLSESQMLKSIRDITGQKVDRVELEEWYGERDKLKKKKNNAKKNRARIKELQDNIYNMMYIKEYITVVMENAKDYDYMFKKGFTFNGKTYRRMSCSASQARVSTIVFVDETIKEELRRRLDNGRDLGHLLAPSKYNAYFGLYSSAIREVRKPRFCVVPDFEDTREVDVDYVIETDKDSDDIIEPRTLDIKFNLFDGSGMISPEFAAKWAEDLGEDYVPCQFCLRFSFTKGMVNEFDFVEWCKENNNGNYIIKDIYGKDVDLRNIDVILSEGQVKLWDSWPSQEEFERCSEENGIIWGITKYSPKRDKDVLLSNYQYIQTLNLYDEDIERLCQDTVDYINGVSYSDPYYSMLFMMGDNMDIPDIKKYMESSDNYWLKSLILEHKLLDDKYSKEKIRDMIVRRIEQACLGRIITRGNYQCIVPDNFAYMEAIVGKKPVGLLKAGEFYSQYWNNVKDYSGERTTKIDCMRSPLTHFSEHYAVDLKMNEDTEKWYKYSYSGIIVNVHDNHTMHFAGSDYDFDILATTNNREYIDGIYPNQRVVTYAVKKPHKKKFDENDLYITDTFSFGTKIGQITNATSTFVAMMADYDKDSEEYKLLGDRVKAGCAAQSRQIDKTKIGENVKTLGTICQQYMKRSPEDTPEERNRIEFYNKLVADKKPYFFKYKYKELYKEINLYNEKVDREINEKFGMSLKEFKVYALNSPDSLTDDERATINLYKRNHPALTSQCVMNKVCKYIEGIDFEIKKKIRSSATFDYKVLQTQGFTINQKIYARIKYEVEETFKEWEEKTKANKKSKVQKSFIYDKQDLKFEREAECKALKERLEGIISNEESLANHLVYLFYVDKPSFSKSTLWNLVGRQIYNNIRSNKDSFYFPVKNSNGNIEFLYEKYLVEKIEINDQDCDYQDYLDQEADND